MKSSKLLQTLETFSEKEFKDFEKIITQKFHKNDRMLLFIKFISAYYPEFNEEDVTKNKVYYYVYGNSNFEDIRIRELMSSAFKVLKEYLISIQVYSSDFYYELDLLKQFRKRKLDRLYDSQLKTVKKLLAKDKYKNIEHYRRKYLLADVENEFFSDKHIRALDENIQIKLDNLDYYYFASKLKESCHMLNRQKLLNQQYNNNLFDDVERIISENKDEYLNQVSIKCYYEIYKLVKTEDDENQLEETLKILKENGHQFQDNELKSMYDFPQNYCIRNINRGNESYIKPLFKLQEFLIHQKLNFVNGYISQISYRNIVTLALKLKEFDWSEQFIEEYRYKVTPDSRENSYNMNKANLYFSLKEYDKTIELLNQVDFSDAYYATYSKIILLKTYYALKEYETLSYFITAFKLYLKRNKQISPSFKKSTDLFLVYFKKVFNVAEKIDFSDSKKVKDKLVTIYNDIELEKNILNRVWLLEIIEDLRK